MAVTDTIESPAKESFAALLDGSPGVANGLEGTVIKGRVIGIDVLGQKDQRVTAEVGAVGQGGHFDDRGERPTLLRHVVQKTLSSRLGRTSRHTDIRNTKKSHRWSQSTLRKTQPFLGSERFFASSPSSRSRCSLALHLSHR